MNDEEHFLACAVELDRHYGEEAPLYVVQRIETLKLGGDLEAVARWQAIGALLDSLRGA